MQHNIVPKKPIMPRYSIISTVFTVNSCSTVVMENNTAPPRHSISPTRWFFPLCRKIKIEKFSNRKVWWFFPSIKNSWHFGSSECVRRTITCSRRIFIVVNSCPNQASHPHQGNRNADYVHHSVSHPENQTRQCQCNWYSHAVEQLKQNYFRLNIPCCSKPLKFQYRTEFDQE